MVKKVSDIKKSNASLSYSCQLKHTSCKDKGSIAPVKKPAYHYTGKNLILGITIAKLLCYSASGP